MDILVTYSLLSVIRERKGNIKSLIGIFQELCESILADNSFERSGSGVIDDLRGGFQSKFNITIPYPTLKIILKNIKTLHKTDFELFTDFAFSFDSNSFKSLKREIDEENARTKELREIYKDLCKDVGIESILGIDFFIEVNKRELLSYLNNKSYTIPDTPEFGIIKTLFTVPDYKERIEKLVLGSLISSYMDLDIEAGVKTKTLLLDTNFIISLFDLHSTQSYSTCSEIISASKRFGFELKVLPETITEVKNLLHRKAWAIKEIPLFFCTESSLN